MWQLAIDSAFYSETVKEYNSHHDTSSDLVEHNTLLTIRQDIQDILAKYHQREEEKAMRVERQIVTLLHCHPCLQYHPCWVYLLLAMLQHFQDYNLYVFFNYLVFQFYPKDFFLPGDHSFDYLALSLQQFIESHLPRVTKSLTAVWKDGKNRKQEKRQGVEWLSRRLALRFYHYLFLDIVDLPQAIQVLDVFLLTSYEAVYSTSLALL